MNKLIEGLTQTGTTLNGAKANLTTTNHALDLFFMAGASRGKDITVEFHRALGENMELTCRLLQWLRDARGGAGERQTFKTLMLELIKVPEAGTYVQKIIEKIPELGRFDDLKIFMDTPFEIDALQTWANALREDNGLAFKWAPRKDKKGALKLRKHMGFNTEKAWRKFIVAGSTTVEQQMCAKKFNEINFEQVPSVAMARYSSAFNRNAGELFQAYKDKVSSGQAKINTKALFPYDVVQQVKYGDVATANLAWDNLPNYIPEGENIITVVDTSGSMGTIVSGNLTAYDMSTSLGLYTAERLTGAFKDAIITFSSRPTIQFLKGTLQNRLRSLRAIHENTNLSAVFDKILMVAEQNNVPQEDMPTKVLIISDMQFDSATNRQGHTALREAELMFAEAGYKIPQLVFWNVCAYCDSYPAQSTDNNALMISGYSPAILGDVLAGDINPEKAMLKVLMKDKYNL